MVPDELTRLKCDSCNAQQFTKRCFLTLRESGGVVEEPCGYLCCACGAAVDQAKMVRRLELARKKVELDALKADLDGEPAAPAPKAADARKPQRP